MENNLASIRLHEKCELCMVGYREPCRSQIAEALSKYLAADVFESYSAGTDTKPQLNQNAMRSLNAPLNKFTLKSKICESTLLMMHSKKQPGICQLVLLFYIPKIVRPILP